MDLNSPTVNYYRHHHGQWQGVYRFQIKSWPIFWKAGLGLINRLVLLNLAMASRLGIRIWVHTTLDASEVESGQVVHTTKIGKFGVAFYASREVFTLNAHGVTMELARVQRLWPLSFWPLPEDHGTGNVSEDGCATYDWVWYDRRMMQTTQPEADGLRLTQVSDWSWATVLLNRLKDDVG